MVLSEAEWENSRWSHSKRELLKLIRNDFKDTKKLSTPSEAFCVLYGINFNDCAVELKSFTHTYAKLKKFLSAHYADEQDITIRHNNAGDNTTSSTDKENEYKNEIDA